MTDQEINEAIARKLGVKFGIESKQVGDTEIFTHRIYPLPNYCHDIKAAWGIVEHLTKENKWFRLENNDGWHFGPVELCGDELYIDEPEGIADTAPMAICLAFLKLQ